MMAEDFYACYPSDNQREESIQGGHSDPFKPRIHGDNVPSRKGHGLDEGRMHPYEAVPGNLGIS